MLCHGYPEIGAVKLESSNRVLKKSNAVDHEAVAGDRIR